MPKLHDPSLKKTEFLCNGSLDEISAVTDIAKEDFAKLINMRPTEDGSRLEERLGLAEIKTDFGEDIFGYFTYYDEDSAFCQLAILETEIQRKVGAGAWTSIHTFSSSIAHKIEPIEIQGKVFVINEIDSRMIHHDKVDYQIGIDAPTTLPTLTAGAGGSMVAGTYRYAVTFVRSGNYDTESNPIKSTIGTATITGAGLDDLTSGGTYTGSTNITCRVRIDGTGTPDTCEVSYDGGTTWHVTDMALSTTMYLNYGIELTWAATTGHTATNYWDIACSAAAVAVIDDQQVTLSSIPTSSDAQVDQRKIYRTLIDGSKYYWIATINDNTTTGFVDNITDSAGELGTLLTETRDVMPDGKFARWWDDRMWVSGENLVYYSGINKPEEFYLADDYVRIQHAKGGDELMQMIDYKDALYVFKRDSITAIQKQSDGTYSQHLFNTDVGCVASWSMQEVANLLMFLSHRGWEVYNGFDTNDVKFSLPLTRTLNTIDTTNYDLITSTHIKKKNDVLLNIPDRTGGNSAITVVYNYVRNVFYQNSYYKVPSAMAEARDSAKKAQNYFCSRDGYLCTMESGYQDGSTNITSTIRKGFRDLGLTCDIRLIEVEYELPTGKTLTMNMYYDFDKDVFQTKGLEGSTPSATDIELRRPIKTPVELGGSARYYSAEITNAENLGGAYKLNKIIIWHVDRAYKGTKKGD